MTIMTVFLRGEREISPTRKRKNTLLDRLLCKKKCDDNNNDDDDSDDSIDGDC